MSYLSALRLHFAGGFVAAPSTVNNDITHYNNADFKPEYQLPQSATSMNGWWNPTGDNRFTVDCRATAAGYQDGSAAIAGTDPVLAFAVKSINRPNAKIVDLDPQQQMVSMVFGMELSVGSATGGVPLLKGVFEPAPFTDNLSAAKRTAMIRWLSHVGPDGKPLLGTAPSPSPPRNLFTAGGVAIGGKARMAEQLFADTAGINTAGTDADQPA